MRIASIFVLVAALLVAHRPLCAAPDAEAKAKAHYANGRRLSSTGKYAEARAEFLAGYRTSGRPLFLFNAAECARLDGDRAAAIDGYEQYLRAEPSGKQAAEARTRMTELRAGPPGVGPAAARPTTPTTTKPPTSTVTKPSSAPPATKPLPSPAQVAATQAAPADPLLAPTEPSPPLYKRWPFWVGVGVAVAAGSVAIYFATRSGRSCSGCVEVDLR